MTSDACEMAARITELEETLEKIERSRDGWIETAGKLNERLVQTWKKLELHDAYREAAVGKEWAYRHGLYYSAERARCDDLIETHAPAIRAAMGEDDGQM
jgi:hypothetical protein